MPRNRTQFINRNNIRIVINNEQPKKRRRRRRRKPKASIDRVNNLRFNNNLKPVLSHIPLSTQVIHQDKLTTEGLKESHVRTTQALKQLTDYMTTHMGQPYRGLPDTPTIEEVEDRPPPRQLEERPETKTPVGEREGVETFFTPSPTESDEEIDADDIEASNLWRDILLGKDTKTNYRSRLQRNAKLRRNVYEKMLSGSERNRVDGRDTQIKHILESIGSRRGDHLRKKRR